MLSNSDGSKPVIGHVQKTDGYVFAIAPDGSKRALQEGDPLYLNDTVVSESSSPVYILLVNSEVIELGGQSQLVMLQNMLLPESSSDIDDPSEAEEILDAIAERADSAAVAPIEVNPVEVSEIASSDEPESSSQDPSPEASNGLSGEAVVLERDATELEEQKAIEPLSESSEEIKQPLESIQPLLAPEKNNEELASSSPVNYAPTAQNMIMGSSESATELEGKLQAFDANTGEALKFSLVTTPDSGQLILNDDGSFRFLPGSDFDYLAAGEQTVVTFIFEAMDSNGASSRASVDITITGDNNEGDKDTPETAKTVLAQIVQSDEETTIDLLSQAFDKDPDALSVTQLRLTEGNEAGVSIGLDGNSLSIDPEAYKYLAAGETETLTYEYLVTNSRGESVLESVTITLSGNNDQPQVREAVVQTFDKNSDDFNVDLLAGAFDLDSSDNLNAVSLRITAGDPSGITIADDGNSLDVDASAYGHLAAGESEVIEYSYEIEDGQGGVVSQSASITIEGINDNPEDIELSGTRIDENQDGAVVGTLSTTDKDLSDNHTYTVDDHRFEVVDGDLKLKEGIALDHETDESIDIEVTTTDADGAAYSESFTLEVSDINEAPVSSDSSTTIDEDSLYRFTLNDFPYSDQDDSDTLAAVVIETLPASGSLELNGTQISKGDTISRADIAAGSLTFLPEANQSADNYTYFNFRVSGGALSSDIQTFSISVDPLDDAPVAGNVDLGSTPEDTSYVIKASDLLASASDVDGDSLTIQSVTLADPATGSLADNHDGTWSYTPTAHYFADDVTFNFTVSDGTSGDEATASATLDVISVNDAAVIAGVDTGAVTEDDNATLTTSGNLTVTDVDANEAVFQAEILSGNHGQLSINADGSWTYSADNSQSAIQTLEDGDSLTDSFSVQTADGTQHIVTATIHGTNDAPLVTAGGALAYTKNDGDQVIDSNITLSDIDSVTLESATITISNNFVPAEDSLAFTNHNGISGSWDSSTGTMTLSGTATVAQYQAALRTVTYSNSSGSPFTADRTVSFSVDDGHNSSQIVTSTIIATAVNNAPVTAGTLVTSDEDTPYIFSTSDFTFSDPDAGHTLQSIKITQLPLAGELLFNGSAVTVGMEVTKNELLAGRLKFEPAQNEHGNLYASFEFQVSDGHLFSSSATFDFSITPVNDDPTVSSAIAKNFVEDSASVNIDLLESAADVDTGDTLSVTRITLSSGDDSGITVNGNTLTVDPGAYDYLPNGVTETIVYSYDIEDGNGGSVSQTATLVITGTNDNANITGLDTATVTEDSHASTLTTSGSLTVTDADQNEARFQAETLTATHGDLVIDASGQWTYTADNTLLAIQSLGDGDTLSETFTVTTAGGDNHNVTITIVGTNDGPIISGVTDVAGAVSEIADGGAGENSNTLTDTGSFTIADVDLSDQQNVSVTAAANGYLGSLTATVADDTQGDGSGRIDWSFSVDDADVDYLSAGQTLTQTYTVTVDDGEGGTVDQQVTITITGTNDAAVITGDDSGSVTEDAGNTLTTSGTLSVTDADGGEASFTAETITGSYGSLAINASGSWSYSASNSHADIQALGDGDTLTETVTVRSLDGTTHNIVITINGSNDGPVIDAGVANQSATEEQAFSYQIPSNAFSDIEGDNLTYSATLSDGSPLPAWLAFDAATRTFSGTPDDPDVGNLSVKISVSDGSATTDVSWSLDVIAVNDAPELSGSPLIGEIEAAYSFSNNTDQSGNGNNLTLSGSAALSSGRNGGQAFEMDGSSGSGEISGLEVGGAMTISAWVKYDSLSQNWSRIVDFADGAANNNILLAHVGTSSTLAFEIFDGGSLEGQLHINNFFAAGEWVHVTATVDDNGVMRVYKNGELAGENLNGAAPPEMVRSGNYIGKSHWNDGDLDGSIGDLAIFNTDLGAHQVKAVYQADSVENLVSDAFHLVEQSANGTVLGSVAATDVDSASNQLTYSLTNDAGGRFTINSATGEISVADSTQLDHDSNASHTIRVQVSDGQLSSTRDYTVYVNSSTLSTNEDTSYTLTLTDLSSSDQEADAMTQIKVSTLPDEGTLKLNGVVVTANQVISKADIEADLLVFEPDSDEAGDNYTSFGFQVYDGSSYSGEHTRTFDVAAVNDAPTISSATDVTGAVTEIVDGGAGENSNTLTDTGSFTIADADLADQQSVSVSAGANGYLGSLTASVADDTQGDGSGRIDWSFSVDDADVDYLSAGQTLTQTYTVSVDDGEGGTVDQQVTITITGTNDAAVITGDDSGSVTEDAGNTLTTSGTLSVTDADGGEASFTAETITGSYGSLAINGNGSWSYSASNSHADIQALGDGDTLTETLTVQSLDGTTHDIDITINGTNDAPTAANNNLSLSEAGQHTFSHAEFGFSDVDSGDSLASITLTSLPATGSLTLNGSAVTINQVVSASDIPNLVFTADASINGSHHGSLGFKVSDGTQQSSAYTIDFYTPPKIDLVVLDGSFQPVITGTGQPDATLNFTINSNSYSATVGSDGHWSFTPSLTLNDGDPLNISVTSTETGGIASAATTYSADISLGDAQDNTVAGGSGIDLIHGGAGADVLTGGEGNDLLKGGSGQDRLVWEAGDEGTAGSPAVDHVADFAVGAGGDILDLHALLRGEENTTADQFIQFRTEGSNTVIDVSVVAGGDVVQQIVLENTDLSPLGNTDQEIIDQLQSDGQLILTRALAIDTVMGDNRISAAEKGAVLVSGVGEPGAEVTVTLRNSQLTDPSSRKASIPQPQENWAFDGDLSGSSSLTFTGGSPSYTNGPVSGAQAIHLDGIDDQLTAPIDVSENEYAVSFWFKTTDNSGGLFAVKDSLDEDRSLYIENGQIKFNVYDGGYEHLTTTETYNDGEWHHITHTFGGDAGVQKLYIDGEEVLSGSFSSSSFSWQSSITIGKSDRYGEDFLEGDIAGLEIFNKGLTAYEVESIYNTVTETVTVDADGNWSLAGNEVDVSTLSDGDLELTVTQTDSANNVTAASSTITLAGNNAAVISGTDTGNVTEDAAAVNLTVSGTLTITDADIGEASFTAGSTTGTYGSLTINTSGSWTYTADNTLTAIQALGDGDTLTETITVSALDGTPQNVVITITGTNDAPTISGVTDVVGTVTEIVDGGAGENSNTLTDTGSFTIADVDLSDQQNVSVTAAANGYLGSLTAIVADDTQGDGSGRIDWSFSVDDADVDYLSAGQTLTQTYTVTVDDGEGGTVDQQVTITITGTNDAAVITGDDSGSVTEDAGNTLTTSGTLSVTDGDSGEASFTAETIVGSYGSLAINANGSWSYSASNSHADIQALGDGDTLTETVTVRSLDGTTHNIVITINGSNDGPVIDAGVANQSATEEQAFSYQIPSNAFSDIEGDNLSYSATLSDGSPLPAWLTFDAATRTFSGTPDDPDVGNLSVKISVSDGSATTDVSWSLDVIAVNDAPELSGSPLIGEIEAAYSFSNNTDQSGNGNDLTLSGSAALSSGRNGGQAFEMDGSSGSGEISGLEVGGAMTISAWVKYDSLSQNWSRIVDFADGAANNNILLAHVGTSSTLAFEIFDGGSLEGQLHINNFFTAGEWVHVTATVDDNGVMRVYKNGELAGENLNGAAPPEMVRSGNYIGKSHWNDGDLDGSIGDLAIFNTDLGAHQVKAVYQADSVENLVSDAFHLVEQSANGTVLGSVAATDVDSASNQLTYSLTNDAGGRFTINSATGEISVADSTQLNHDSNASHTIRVQVSDGQLSSTRDYTVYVNSSTMSTNEDTSYTLTLTDLSSSDQEADAMTQIKVSTLPDEGTLKLNGVVVTANQVISKADIEADLLVFEPDSDEAGDNYTSFGFQVYDGSSYSGEHTRTFDVAAVNDAPTISSATDVTGAVTEIVDGGAGENSNTLTDAGSFTIADVDLSDQQNVSVTAAANGYLGSLTASVADDTQGDGSGRIDWSFSVDDADVDYLSAGQTLTQTYTVTVDDGEGGTVDQQVTITITGTNDAAVITGDDSGSVTEDAGNTLTTSGTLSVTDADGGEASFTAETITGSYGSLAINGNGSWSYSASNSHADIQALGDGDTLTETLTVKSLDGTTHNIVITFNGTNDAPAISSATDVAGAVTEILDGAAGENSNTLTDTGSFTIADVDLSDQQNVSVTAAANGYLGSLTATVADDTQGDGSGRIDWSFSVDDADVDYLSAGQTLTQTYTVTVDDGEGGTVDQQVTITITGTNDAAVITGDNSGSVTEDAGNTLTTSGTLSVTDADGGEASFTAETITGSYGSLAINASGNWSYSASNSHADIQALGDGDTLTETLTVKSLDGTTHNIVITFNGTNDAPAISSATDVAGAVTEILDGAAGENSNTLTDTGSFTIADVDLSDQQNVSVTAAANGYLGSLTATVADDTQGDGSGRIDWSFSVDDADVDYLSAGQTLTQTYTVTVDDGEGATVDQQVTITITGTNDAAVITGDDSGSVTEDAGNTLTTSGTLSVTDGDSGEASFTAETITGSYGSLAINASGTWSYSASNSHADIQALGDGDTLTETLTVRSLDGTTHNIVITFNGTNDAPAISSATDVAGAVTEILDGAAGENSNTLTDTGSFTIADVDLSDQQNVSVTAAANGYLGSLTASVADDTQGDGSGRIDWSFSVDDADVDYLSAGQTLTQTYTVTVDDGEGGTVDQQVTITITGTNDAAVITGDDSGSVTEDAGNTLTTSGTLSVTDGDSGEASFTAETIVGSYGSLAINANGSWSYSASNSHADIQALGDGDTLTETVTVRSLDGTTHNIVITINGNNDGPVIDAGVTNQSATEEQAFSYQIPSNAFSDIEGDNLTYSATLSDGSPLPAWLAFDAATRTFSGTPDDPDVGNLSVKISVSDGSATTDVSWSLDVIAVNDAPELSGSPLIGEIEAAYSFSNNTDQSGNGNDLTLSGSAALSSGRNGGQAFEMDGSSGSGEISGLEVGGAMTISAWVKYDSLSQNWSRIVDFADGAANNNILLAHVGTSSTLAFEIFDGGSLEGQLHINNFFTAGEWVHVTATVDDNGVMRVYKNGELAGENLNGAAPPEMVRSGNYIGKSHWNDGDLDGSIGDLAIFNTDLGAHQVKAVYQADSVENLVSDAFHLVEQSANGTVLGSVAATDVDSASNQLTYSLTNDAGGRFTINSATGEISVADSTQLDHDSNASHTIRVQVSDGQLSSTRDYTVYVNSSTLSTNEDTNYTLTLTDLSSSDQEADAMTQIKVSTLPDEGTLKLNGVVVTANQVISKADIEADLLVFEPDSDEAGDNYTSFGFQVYDGSSYSGEHTRTFDVAAVNDAPTISSANDVTGAVTEIVDGGAGENSNTLTDTGSFTIADVDLSDQQNVSVTAAANGYLGSLTASVADDTQGDGSGRIDWSFSVDDADVDYLSAGQTLTQTYTVTVDDGEGGTVDQQVTITITGTNDAAVITGDDSGSVTEDAGNTLTTSGTLSVTDADGGEASFTAETITGSYGSLAINGNGSWSYSASNSHADIQALGDGDTLTETLTVKSLDGTTHNIVITFNGTNDAPAISSATDVAGAVTEILDGAAGENSNTLTDTGSFTIADVDLSDQQNVSVTAAANGYLGSLTATVADDTQGDGSGRIDWSFSVDDADVDYLSAGQTLTQTYTVTVDDGEGGTVDQQVTITITGTNDAAVITGDNSGSVTEDAGNTLTTSGTLSVTDADGGEASFTAETITGSYGSLAINASGNWSYSASNSHADIQALGDGDTLTETLTVKSLDGTTHNIVITFNGTNDGPTIDAGMADQSATEEQAFSYQVPSNAFADIDGDNLTYSATLSDGSPLPAWLSFDPANSTFSGTPDDPDLGQIIVKVTASDGVLSVSDQFKINVAAVNDAPIAPAAEVEKIDFVWGGASITNKSADSLNLPNGFELGDSVWLTKTDGSHGKGVKVQISENQDGTLNFKAIEAKYTDLVTWNSLSSAQQASYFETAGTATSVASSNSDTGYGISDIAVNSGSAVSGFLDSATGKNVDPFSSVENSSNGTVVGSVTATDVEGDNLVYSLTDDAGGRFAINSASGQITVADGSLLDYETSSSHAITVEVSDGQLTSQQNYTIQLSDTNDAPELVGSLNNQTVAEESAFSYTTPANAFSDDDGDVLTYSASLANGNPLPAWLTFDAATRTFSGTPDDPDVGNLSIKISVSDGFETTDVYWSLDVTAVNDAPELSGSPLIDGIEAAYSFSDNTDLSGNGNDLTLSGSAALSSGRNGGQAFEMDGSSGSGEISGLEVGGAMTISAWVKYDSLSQNWSRIVDFADGAANNNILLAHVGTSSTLAFEIFDGGSLEGQLHINNFFTAGEWVHVTATVDDNGVMRVYKNGELAGENLNGAAPPEMVRSGNYIGKSHWNDGDLDGSIGDLAIFNTDLGAHQVKAVYQADSVENLVSDAFHLVEQSANGTVLGSVAATDVDSASNQLTYSLTNDAGGRFTINSATGEISVADSTQLDHDSNASHTIRVQVSDGQLSSTRDYTVYVNSSTLSTNEDTNYTLTLTDLSSSDQEADAMTQIKVSTLPDEGTLKLNGVVVTANQVISKADIEAGLLIFEPDSNEAGDNYTSIGFKVHDGSSYSGEHTRTFDVTAVADSVTMNNISSEVLNSTFDGNNTDGWQRTNPHGISHSLVKNNRLNNYYSTESYRNIDTSDSSVQTYELTFILHHERNLHNTTNIRVKWNGQTVATYTEAPGSGTHTSTKTILLNATGNPTTELRFDEDLNIFYLDNIRITKVRATDEDNAFILPDLGITQVDTDGSETLTVSADGVPAGAVLTDGSHSITADGTAVDISGWDYANLQITPPANSTDTMNLTFTATTTESNGESSSVSETLSIRVNSIDDKPVSSDNSLLLKQTDSYTFSSEDFSFIDGDAGDTLQSITITSLPASGALTLNGAAVTANQVITAADLGNLTYTAPATDPDVGTSFGFTVSDGSLSSDPQTFTLNVRGAYSDNLLTNGSGQNFTADWNIIENGADGWATTVTSHDGDNKAWITSSAWAKKSQTVDLLAEGFSEKYLDSAPEISVSDWFRDTLHNDQYYLKVELRDASHNVIASYDTGVLTANDNWQEATNNFSNYGAGARYVYFEHGGKSSEQWSGHFGTVIDNSKVTIKVGDLVGTNSGEIIDGTAQSDTLKGEGGADTLLGDAGDDLIFGGDGEDIITGGAGDDILTGGNDSDTFVWLSSDLGSVATPAEDVIKDFTTGSGGDIIDLSDILVDDSISLDQYLNLNFSNGDTTIEVMPGADGSVTQKIKLEGVDLSSYGGGSTEAQILNNLLNDGNLQID